MYIYKYIGMYKNVIPPATYLQTFLTPGFINRSAFNGGREGNTYRKQK